MSNQLLTMKFMQRASATGGASPGDEPPTKRSRLSRYSASSVPSPRTDSQAVKAALAEEEQKREAALEREAYDRGETKWYLSFHAPQQSAAKAPLQIVSAGFSVLDPGGPIEEPSSDKGEEVEGLGVLETTGRKSFGKFKKTERKERNDNKTPPESASGSDSGHEEDDDPNGVKALINQGRKKASEKVRGEGRAKQQFHTPEAHERRKKEINLNRLQSISGGGTSMKDRNITCHRCGEKGHVSRNCSRKT